MKSITDFINEQSLIESKPFMSDDPEVQNIVNILEYPQDVADITIKDGDVYIIPSKTTAERFGLQLKPIGDVLGINKYNHFYVGKRKKVINHLTINCENVKKIRDIDVLPDQFEFVTLAHTNSTVVNDYLKKAKHSELQYLTLGTYDDIDIEPVIDLQGMTIDWGWNGTGSFSIDAKSKIETLNLKRCPSIKSLPSGLKKITLSDMKFDCFKEFDSETFKKHTNVDDIFVASVGSTSLNTEEAKAALKGEGDADADKYVAKLQKYNNSIAKNPYGSETDITGTKLVVGDVVICAGWGNSFAGSLDYGIYLGKSNKDGKYTIGVISQGRFRKGDVEAKLVLKA